MTGAKSKEYAGAWAYLRLLRNNKKYRLYFASHLCQHAGDWFVHVASLLAVQRLRPGYSTAISGLVAARMLPKIVLTTFGGVIADSFDKRKCMIALDCFGGVAVMLYILALRVDSLTGLYGAAIIRASIQSIYEPMTHSLLPLLVTDEEDLKRAVAINSTLWSSMVMIGGLLAGYTGATFGVEACYVVDALTYFISAWFMYFVKGNYNVAAKEPSSPEDGVVQHAIPCSLRSVMKPLATCARMIAELGGYLWNSQFSILVLLKSSGNITWGFADVLNVSFSQIKDDEAASSARLGIIFFSVGLGCMLGPLTANCFTDIKKPSTIQLACIVGLSLVTIGWYGIAFVSAFQWICFFTLVRSSGLGIVWVNSTLLLQKLVPEHIRGRVIGLDFGLTVASETLAAFSAGALKDANNTVGEISLIACVVAALSCLFWMIVHECEGGAAHTKLPEVSIQFTTTPSL
eukprot:CAMPEP_0195527276 /NCGR_PEP_ID=MMETSP0794_2-20130614/28827_1 /TAXON_ID=515487 /ORGANISM="Stephanopyxis turris, Strain CCMP 815" /LENGTH=459 /DNA_ID=CAMNT_0040658157 /DNA_START=21 /DNA_END=1400 /DNA_ORIENTATION=-